jgi:hypothetical protein
MEFVQLASAIHIPLLGALLEILRGFFFISLIVSAVGFFRMKKWALIISYVQFPLRFGLMLLSFGFIHYLSRLFHSPSYYQPLINAAMILECMRLICSVWIHRTLTLDQTGKQIIYS